MLSATAMMQRAVELARNGFPAPNPRVGCVIVRDGEVVGEGWHDHAGGPHAEVVALSQAGVLARGADVYVTLEPCNHQGRTGPCSVALVEAGVRRVIFAVPDPNPIAAGGAEFLRGQGIAVESGVGEPEARDVNRVWLFAMANRMPYFCVKVATTEDGFLARLDGTSKWITGEAARAVGHRLRAEMGSVMVGVGTLLADDPLLTARVPGVVNQPVKIVLDLEGRATGQEAVWQSGRTIHVVPPGATSHGERLEAVPGHRGAFDLSQVGRELFRRGIVGVLVEGGARTITEVFSQGLVQEFHRFIAPIRWEEGISWIENEPEFDSEAQPQPWRWLREQQVGPDRHLCALRTGNPAEPGDHAGSQKH